MPTPTPRFDARYSAPTAEATPWERAEAALADAELYWLTTLRADGRPHVVPLIGLWLDGAVHFTTGPEEQKARNLASDPRVAVTTGSNTWARGLDVVVEGEATRVTDRPVLLAMAQALLDKYGEDWRFEVGDGVLGEDGHPSWAFRLSTQKVLAFAKDPHAQTSYRFG